MSPVLFLRLAWGLWLLSWLAAAPWSAPTLKRVVTGATTLSRLVIAGGAALLFDVTTAQLGAGHLWDIADPVAYALASLTVTGFAFAWWARLHLGLLWSGAITRKQDHQLVDTGPYALVRHPIYTGLIVAALLSAAAEATLPALVGAALMALGLWGKAALEERFLRQELGVALYDSYRRRVPMLIPFAQGRA